MCNLCSDYYVTSPTAQLVQSLYKSDMRESTDDANFRIVTISWNETTTGKHGMYNVTVEPAVQECNSTCVTSKTYMELKLAVGTAYNLTIITVMCNGSLRSTESKPFPILLNCKSETNTPIKMKTSYNRGKRFTTASHAVALCFSFTLAH